MTQKKLWKGRWWSSRHCDLLWLAHLHPNNMHVHPLHWAGQDILLFSLASTSSAREGVPYGLSQLSATCSASNWCQGWCALVTRWRFLTKTQVKLLFSSVAHGRKLCWIVVIYSQVQPCPWLACWDFEISSNWHNQRVTWELGFTTHGAISLTLQPIFRWNSCWCQWRLPSMGCLLCFCSKSKAKMTFTVEKSLWSL